MENLLGEWQEIWIPGLKERKLDITISGKMSEELKCSNLLVITEDYLAEEKTGNKKIRFMPLWKWLLS